MSLTEFTRQPEPSVVAALSARFRDALLLFGSQTDENQDCADRLEVGTLPSNHGATYFGLRLRNSTTSVSSVLWRAEGTPIPAALAESLPELSQQQWDACLRLATLTLSAMESTLDGHPPSAKETTCPGD